MSRYLVVANQTVTNPLLIGELKALCRQDSGAEFVLLAPATPVRDLLFRRGTDEKAEAVARKHVDKARATYAKEGISLTDAHVGGADPVAAIEQELQADVEYTAVVISTLPGGDSRWLKQQLPQTVESKFGLPVILVEAPPAWTYVP